MAGAPAGSVDERAKWMTVAPTARAPRRIGVLYPDPNPFSPSNWSGTPSGLRDGLLGNGIEAIPIPCRMPAWESMPAAMVSRLGGARGVVAHREPAYIAARTRAIARSVSSSAPLDGIIAMGTDMYDLPRALAEQRVPVATYDDGTITLFRRYAGSDISLAGYPDRALTVWAGRQAAAWAVADSVCVSTNWAAQSIVNDFHISSDKLHVVGMGHRPRQGAIERDYAAARFLFVGVDWRRKNGARVLAAFARLREQVPHATLDVVGRHHSIVQAGVTDHGFLARGDGSAQALLDELYARATAFVLPSLFDPYGIAYLEAASAGLPVIATSFGGAGEVVGDGAIVVDPYDPEALYGAMLQLVDGKVARAMGQRAKAKAAEATWSSVAARIVSTLEARQPAVAADFRHS